MNQRRIERSEAAPQTAWVAPWLAIFVLVAVLFVLVAALIGCGTGMLERGEGIDIRSVPPDLRGDYALFAQRCSKCHSLARPLNSGITNDEFWRLYVERMRRQPGSGISEGDAYYILRFLHWYSASRQAGVVR